MDRKYGYKYFSSIRIDKGTGLLYRDVKLKLNVNSTTGLLHKEENPFITAKKILMKKSSILSLAKKSTAILLIH